MRPARWVNHPRDRDPMGPDQRSGARRSSAVVPPSAMRVSRVRPRLVCRVGPALTSSPSLNAPRSVSHLDGSVLCRPNLVLLDPVTSALSFRPSLSVSFLVGLERVLPITMDLPP